jgi:hypothetical protein
VLATIVAMLVLPAGLAGADGLICTQMGCSSGIVLRLPEYTDLPKHAARITVCMDDRCQSSRLSRRWSGSSSIHIEDRRLAGPARVRVRVVVRDARGRKLLRRERRVTLTRNQPNGAPCPPTCWGAGLELRAHGHLALL